LAEHYVFRIAIRSSCVTADDDSFVCKFHRLNYLVIIQAATNDAKNIAMPAAAA
jgi:hypothetical protein